MSYETGLFAYLEILRTDESMIEENVVIFRDYELNISL